MSGLASELALVDSQIFVNSHLYKLFGLVTGLTLIDLHLKVIRAASELALDLRS